MSETEKPSHADQASPSQGSPDQANSAHASSPPQADPPQVSPTQVSPPQGNWETQNQRRVKYGLNLLIATVAALAVVAMVNWLASDIVTRLELRHYLRADMTAAGRFSLSPQTRQIIADLDKPYRLVTLLTQPNAAVQPARAAMVEATVDLVDEFAQRSNQLTAEHLDPTFDTAGREALSKQIESRFADQLTSAREAIVDTVMPALGEIRSDTREQSQQLRAILNQANLPEGDPVRTSIGDVAVSFGQFDQDISAQTEAVAEALDGPLPDLSGAKSSLVSLLERLEQGVYSRATQWAQQLGQDSDTPGAVREAMLRMVDAFQATRDRISASLQALQDVQIDEAYTTLLNKMAQPDTVVILGPEKVEIVPLSRMYRISQDMQQVADRSAPTPQFLGEEVLTGALLRMQWEQQPLAVFVPLGQQSALGPRGGYTAVAQRLENLSFQVQQWNPQGRPGPMGQPMPAEPAPEPEPGQKAVWIVLPDPQGANNPQAMMMAQQKNQEVAQMLQQRLAQGDGLLANLTISPMAAFGQNDPIASLIQSFGLNAQLDRIVLRQVQIPDRKPQPESFFTVERWNDDLVITDAIEGLTGVFVQTNPIVLNDTAEGVTTWPLVTLDAPDMWAHTNMQQPQPEFDPNTASDRFTVAAAAQRQDGARVVAVADPLWANDRVTTNADPGLRMPGLAPPLPAAYPANAELFANSVLWLAHYDQLIAASPRTQDIPRVGDMTPEGMIALRWTLLAGIPLAVVAVGLAVYFVRRGA